MYAVLCCALCPGTMNQVSQYIALQPAQPSNQDSLTSALTNWTLHLMHHS